MNSKNFKQSIIWCFVFFIACFFITACKTKTNNPQDTTKSGTIHISVDESFKPVIEEQVKVFEKSFPGTHIIAHYKTEADCFKDLFSDTSNRMIIVTRGLTAEEDSYFKDSLHYLPHWDNIANDAITVIVNSKSNDTLFTIVIFVIAN